MHNNKQLSAARKRSAAKPSFNMKTTLAASVALGLSMNSLAATLIWSDEFNGPVLDESVWTYALGDGSAAGIPGWGNQELQTYTNTNTAIANGKLVISARRENQDGKEFTSARLLTKDKVSVKYGRVEASIKLPDMNNGLWPAFWMLGDGNRWPYTGEIDIMEAGFNASTTDTNAVAKANVFWRAEEAGVTGNLQYGNEDEFKYDANAQAGLGLNDDYFVYRVDWTPSSMSTYVLETDANGEPIESTAHQIFSIDNSATFESEFFSGDNFYILLNLAVGGWLPFPDTAENTSANITALPTAGSEAQMLVDYVRVYELPEGGEVTLGNVEEELLGAGGFGIYADDTNTDSELAFGVDAELFLWEDATAPEIIIDTPASPYGETLYDLTFPANQWAGLTLNSSDVLNIANYAGGSLRLKVNTSSQEAFRISMESAGGAAGVDFLPGEEKFGLVRDGAWHDVEIPLELLVTHFEKVYSPFIFSNVEGSNPAADSRFLIDEIHLSAEPAQGFTKYVPTRGDYGLYTDSSVAEAFELGVDGDLYLWADTLSNGPAETYNGQEALSFVPNNVGWFGLGFTADKLYDMSAFESGALHIVMKTTGTETINLGVNTGLAAGTIVFEAGSDPYGFARDGQWHEMSIPLADFDGLNLSGVETLLSISGAGNIPNLAIADLYFEYEESQSPVVSSISLQPTTLTLEQGSQHQFSAQAYDQTGNPMDASFNWSATGGTITETGLYTATTSGNFTVTASAEGYQANAPVTVTQASADDLKLEAEAYVAMSGIQTEPTADVGGGDNVGWIDAGDWVEYTVNVPTAGTYRVDYRVAGTAASATLDLAVNGATIDTTTFDGTGDWQNWTTVSSSVELAAGTQTIRVTAQSGGWNLNWLELVYDDSGLELQVEAEAYTAMSGVQTEATSDTGGGTNVGWIEAGDWMEYQVTIPTAGTYAMTYRVASLSEGGDLTVSVDGNTVDTTSFNATGGWQNWTSVTSTAYLSAGTQTIRITANQGGWNFNWFEIKTNP